MYRLPLICKGCGQHLNVPEPTAEPAPAPKAAPVETHAKTKQAEPVPAPSLAAAQRELPTETKPDLSVNITPPVLAPMPLLSSENPDEKLLKQKFQAGNLPIEHSVEPAERPRSLVVLVDVATVLVLLIVGAFIGEMLAHQPTGELLHDAATAPKFPPVELILWLAPIAMLCLVYWMLASRHKSLGYWLQRRRSLRT